MQQTVQAVHKPVGLQNNTSSDRSAGACSSNHSKQRSVCNLRVCVCVCVTTSILFSYGSQQKTKVTKAKSVKVPSRPLSRD